MWYTKHTLHEFVYDLNIDEFNLCMIYILTTWISMPQTVFGRHLLWGLLHKRDVIMGAVASQITSLAIVYSNVYSGADQRKYQSSASPAFVRGIHRWPVNSPHKWPVTRKTFPFDDVIMYLSLTVSVFFSLQCSSNNKMARIWRRVPEVLAVIMVVSGMCAKRQNKI